MDEPDLIRRAAAGDLAAFTALVDLKRERVFRIARNVLGDAEAARDVAQEVFLRLYRVLRRFRSGGRFDAWLHRITLNLALDALRRERPHREAAPLETAGERAGAGAAHGPDALGRRDIRRIFTILSARLAPKQRAAFILREIEGISTAEVAAALGATESTVRNHVLQARRILQEELRRRFPEYLPRRRV